MWIYEYEAKEDVVAGIRQIRGSQTFQSEGAIRGGGRGEGGGTDQDSNWQLS